MKPFEEALNRLRGLLPEYDLNRRDEIARYKREVTGKSGLLTKTMDDFRGLDVEEKRMFGGPLNLLKNELLNRLSEAEAALLYGAEFPQLDISLPGVLGFVGGRHPLTIIREEVCSIFGGLGFSMSEGPEVETEWYNFSALNFPEDHPARDMQDTFFVEGFPEHVLRTHTSGVQIRAMEGRTPPIRVLSPGRVFRCDSDATHSPVFHQIEGLYVDRGVSFADLKEVLFYFVSKFFGSSTRVRFRPSYFPFTEPSAEMDIGWGEGAEFRWMEILGCGMVDPRVLANCGIDSDLYSGYAFGMGIERMAMLRYGIKDIRLFYENDRRFLDQFLG
jgi:phenylalanyl-tRNA synthetase alpha chain